MRVKVTDTISETFTGFYDHVRRRPGDVFTIPDTPRRLPFPGEMKLIENSADARSTYEVIKDKDGRIPQTFSFKWMIPVGESAPERITTAQQAVNKEAERIKREREEARSGDAPPKQTAGDVI